jgi:hypothetical protein
MFMGAAILCVSSKSQHAPLAVFLWGLAVVAALSFIGRRRTTAALAASLLIPAVAAVTFYVMPDSEKGPAQYAVIFISILHSSPAPLDDLRELGLGPEYLRYVDYWPERPSDDPLANPEWRAQFASRTNYARIAEFYLRHPWRASAIVYRALEHRADRRHTGLGNYERANGLPAGTQTSSFGWWSAFRSALFRVAPWHIVAWHVALLGLGVWLAIRPSTIPVRLSIFTVLLPLMGLVELAVSSLADAGETERHLFLFHVITDFTIVLAMIIAAWVLQGKASFRANS